MNTGDIKVSLGECLGVVIDEVGAGARAPVVTVGVSGPITTESQVDDDVVPPKLPDVALRVGEERSWGTLPKV